MRLDDVLVARGLAETRQQAERLIRAGQVWLGDAASGVRGDKPGQLVAPDVAQAPNADWPTSVARACWRPRWMRSA